jgi:hypothetical protein
MGVGDEECSMHAVAAGLTGTRSAGRCEVAQPVATVQEQAAAMRATGMWTTYTEVTCSDCGRRASLLPSTTLLVVNDL